jgi:hypothetical protein
VNRYTVARVVKKEESSNKEEIKKVNIAKAFKSCKTVKMWKLQKGNSQDLQALDRIIRKITRHKVFIAHQTTIYRFFKLK